MLSMMDIIYRFARFFGLLDEPATMRTSFKRNRVYDDFSSDDETPVLGFKHNKKFRWSDVMSMENHGQQLERRNNHVRKVHNVPVQLRGVSTTSTPNKSSKKIVPVARPGLSRNRPSTPVRITPVRPVIDVNVNVEPKTSTVASVKSKSENPPKPSIPQLDLDDDDSDSSQQDDEVVFVKEVSTFLNRPREHNDEVLSDILEAIKSTENLDDQKLLQRVATTIKKMSAELSNSDSAKLRLAQETQTDELNEIKLDNESNADRQQNKHKNSDPIQLSLTDSSDSEVEIVSSESSSTSVKKDSSRDASLSRSWLHEHNSECYKLQNTRKRVNDTRLAITSKDNSDQNMVRSHMDDEPDSSEDLMLKLRSKYNINQPHNISVIQNPQETLNKFRRWSVITPTRNNEENEASSSSPENIDDWLAKIDKAYFSTMLKTPEKHDDLYQDSSTASKINREQNEGQSSKLDHTVLRDIMLSKLESKYKTDQPKSQEAKIQSKVSTELNTTEWLKRLDAEYFSTPLNTQVNSSHDSNVVEPRHKTNLQKFQDKLDDALQESDIIQTVNCEENEADSSVIAASTHLKLTKRKHKTMSESLSNTRLQSNNVWQINDEQSDPSPSRLDAINDWLAETKSKYNPVQQKWQEYLREESPESHAIPKANGSQNRVLPNKTNTTAERRSKLHSKQTNELPKTPEKPNEAHKELNDTPKASSEHSVTRSFRFNTSEDLMSKLGSLYTKYQKETKNNREQKHELSKSQSEENTVEIENTDEPPTLTPEQEKLVDKALELEPEEEMLVEKFNMRIHRRDLNTLSDLNWLNDEVINFYMNLIMQRSEERRDLPKVYATNTFFFPKLMQSGQAGLRRWTRKVDIFAYDLFMVPVNIDNHWSLIVVDFGARIIKYLNSRVNPNQEILDALLQYLKDEHQDKKRAPFDDGGWETECVKNIPQQRNGSDCGMFACTFAEFSSRDAAYSFTQAHMPYLRRKAALEILTGKLLL